MIKSKELKHGARILNFFPVRFAGLRNFENKNDSRI